MNDELDELKYLTDAEIEDIVRDADRLALQIAGTDKEYKVAIFEYICSFKLDRQRDKHLDRFNNIQRKASFLDDVKGEVIQDG